MSGSAWGADGYLDQPRSLGGLIVGSDFGSQLMVASVLVRSSAVVMTDLLQVGGALRPRFPPAPLAGGPSCATVSIDGGGNSGWSF